MQSWDPFDAPGRLLARFGGRFEGGWPDDALLQSGESHHLPAADVYEDAEGWHVLIDLPGVKSPELAVTLLDDCLIVEAERLPPNGNNIVLHEVESLRGPLRREFILPTRSEPGRALADLSDGVLHILIPRRPAASTVARQVVLGKETPDERRSLSTESIPFGNPFVRHRGDA